MRANLVVIGSHGDVLPFIALGAELRRRGHEVILASAAPFEALARREGLAFVSLATHAQFDDLVSNADLWKPIKGTVRLLQSAMRLLRPTYEFVVNNHIPGDTITIASTLAMGARIAQEQHGLPLITVHLAPFLIRSRFDSPRLPGLRLPKWLPKTLTSRILSAVDKYVLDELCQPVNRFRARLDLPPARNIARSWWNSPDRVIAMFPEWFGSPQRDWPQNVLQVGFPAADLFGDTSVLSPALETFLAEGPAPIAFTFGSAMHHADDLIEASIKVCRKLGRRGLIIGPDQYALPLGFEDQFLQITYAPFSRLLPRCAALVHHGGVGTVASAITAGIPQMLVPLAFDHFDEALRVKRLQIGLSVSRSTYGSARTVRKLRQLLSSEIVRKQCRALAASMRNTDGIAQACDIAEDLLIAKSGAKAKLNVVS